MLYAIRANDHRVVGLNCVEGIDKADFNALEIEKDAKKAYV